MEVVSDRRLASRAEARTEGARRWFVLLGCFVGMGVAMPALLLVPMGLFLISMTAEFGWSRTVFSSVTSTMSLFGAVSLPVAGYLVDRYGARRVIAVGTVLGCGSYAALSSVHGYAGFVAITGLAVMGGNLASYPAFMSLAQRWFDKRLGLALAIASTGLAVGIGAASFIITRTIERHGWRDAFLAVGLSALVIGLVNVIALVRDNRGPVPLAEHRDATGRVDRGGSSLVEALGTRDFWLYSASFSLVILAVVGCNVHLPALLSDRGASPGQLASIVAIGAAGSLLGRLFTGALLDRFPVRGVAALFFLGQAVGFWLLLDGLRLAALASLLLGAVQGAEIDLLGFVIARRFGRVAYARIYGTCFAVTLVGAIIGPIAMATIFDRTGSYHAGLLLFSLSPLLALGLLWMAKFTPEPAARPAISTKQPLVRGRTP